MKNKAENPDDKIKLLHKLISENKSPEIIKDTLRLAPGCKFKSWTETRWNYIKSCLETRKCGEIYDCDDPSNNNQYCGPWGD